MGDDAAGRTLSCRPSYTGLMATAGTSAVVLVSALVLGTSASGDVAETAPSSPRLTRNVPDFVERTCASARATSPIPLVCPPLVRAAGRPSTGATSLRRFDQSGIAFQYPRAWFVTTRPLSNGINPKYRFAVSSVPVQRTAEDLGPCLSGVAKQLPDDGVLVYLREALGADRRASLPRMQPRPQDFRLPNRTDNSLPCFGQGGRWVPFRERGRAFYLGFYIGPKASPENARALGRLVNDIRIASR